MRRLGKRGDDARPRRLGLWEMNSHVCRVKPLEPLVAPAAAAAVSLHAGWPRPRDAVPRASTTTTTTIHTAPEPSRVGGDPLDGAAALLPLEPAARVLAEAGPAGTAGELGGGAGAHAGAAVEDEMGASAGGCRAAEPPARELVTVEPLERRGLGLEGDVDGAGDLARGPQLLRLADVCPRRAQGGRGTSAGRYPFFFLILLHS